ncbi:uncharacterized protein LOC143257768 [Tachypleus tridentatus]|uniref:uncharacterized protein LOC143257768 n=1 Tax=Tachypleus tridentatus TaxID=6853 RepID=UPI003FD2742E
MKENKTEEPEKKEEGVTKNKNNKIPPALPLLPREKALEDDITSTSSESLPLPSPLSPPSLTFSVSPQPPPVAPKRSPKTRGLKKTYSLTQTCYLTPSTTPAKSPKLSKRTASSPPPHLSSPSTSPLPTRSHKSGGAVSGRSPKRNTSPPVLKPQAPIPSSKPKDWDKEHPHSHRGRTQKHLATPVLAEPPEKLPKKDKPFTGRSRRASTVKQSQDREKEREKKKDSEHKKEASGTGANRTVYGTNPKATNHIEETTADNKKVVRQTTTGNGGEGSDDPLSTSGVNRRTAILFKKKTVGSRRGGSHSSGLKRMGARTRKSTDKSDHMSSLTSSSSPVPAFLDSATTVTNVFTMTAASLVSAVKDRPAKRRSRSASQTVEPASPKQKPAAAPLTSLGAFPSSPLPQTDSFKIYRSTYQDQGSDTDHQSETSSDTSDSSSSSDSQSESESDIEEGGESQGATTGDDDTSTLSEPRKGNYCCY